MKNPARVLIVCLAALHGLALTLNATAVEIVVSDPSTPVAVNGLCSITEAIDNANADAAVHADCAKGGGADTIKLQAAVIYSLSAANNAVYGPTGLPVITSTVTIEGAGSTIRRSANNNNVKFRLMAIDAKGQLTLNNLTLRDGLVSSPPEFPNYGCGTGVVGAGILNFGVLELNGSTVRNNSALAFNGGGIGSIGRLLINNSSIRHNTSGDDGGGIASCSHLTLKRSVISDNHANDIGGGLMVTGFAIIEETTLLRNDATIGGGIANQGDLSLLHSTVSDNVGGTPHNDSPAYGGGGIANWKILKLFNSTVSGNDALLGSGGGIHNRGARLVLVNATVASNAAVFGSNLKNDREGQMDFQNALVADAAGIGSDCDNDGAIVTNLSSLVEDGSCPASLNGDPALAPLANNGGLTATHALLVQSIAIDKGNNGICLAKPISNRDQRGAARPMDGNLDGKAHCDIGAYELSHSLGI